MSPAFRPDLYAGTARFYDEFRVGYPPSLFDDLRARVTSTRRLLDVACGTGQIAFGLAGAFAQVWAIDQEPETIEFARSKALSCGISNVRWIVGRAEDLDLALDLDRSFDLVTIGNAFHRLERPAVGERARRWLTPGGHLALLWSNSPWDGDRDWQRVMAEVLGRWMVDIGSTDRVPIGLVSQLAGKPHAAVLAEAGFAIVGEFGFPTPRDWTVEQLVGFMYSTSVLSHVALGPHVEAFERDLRSRLLALEPAGLFHEEIEFSYTLALNP